MSLFSIRLCGPGFRSIVVHHQQFEGSILDLFMLN